MKREKIWVILAGLGIYFFSFGISWGWFNYHHFSSPKTSIVSPLLTPSPVPGKVNLEGPRDQPCPLNGVLYTKSHKQIWQKRRPLLVMIENHRDSRPQSGLSRADIIYEAVAEGGITRFMGVFYCQATEPAPRRYDLGPVRSARTYFLDWASEYGDYPLYVHVGGAGRCADPTVDERVKALCQIEQYGWKDKAHWSDMDQFALSYKICRREPQRTGKTVATEHTMYCDSKALWDEAEKRGVGAVLADGSRWEAKFRPWKFKEEASLERRGKVGWLEFNFWRGYQAYRVRWEYNRTKNLYYRFNGGEPHKDFLTNQQLSAKVVVIQFVKEIGPVDAHKHLLYKTIGRGQALIFQDGKVVSGYWQKKSRTARTLFFASSGQEMRFNRGLIWIEIVPTGVRIQYAK